MRWDSINGTIKGYQGKWQTFLIYYNGLRPKDSDIPPYKLKCTLPGIKEDLGNFKTERIAKDKAQTIMRYWLDNLGIRIKRRERKKKTYATKY